MMDLLTWLTIVCSLYICVHIKCFLFVVVVEAVATDRSLGGRQSDWRQSSSEHHWRHSLAPMEDS